MATTVDLGQQLHFENVKHLPPRAPNGRPWSGCFQNRGRLFSASKQQLVSDACNLQTHSASPEHGTLSPRPPANSNGCTSPSNKHRRVQSAKARMEMSSTQSCGNTLSKDSTGSDLSIFDVNMNLTVEHKHLQQSSRALSKESPSNQYIYQVSLDKSASRPTSVKESKNLAWMPVSVSPAVEPEEEEEKTDDDLKPSVYGYRLKRQVFGSNPDIFSSSLKPAPATTMFKLDDRQTNLARGDQICLQNAVTSVRTIPSHMEPLRPWLNQTVSQEVIGVDPTTCLVFLPLNQKFDDLPVVPLS